MRALQEISLSKGEYGGGFSAVKYYPEAPRYIRITDIDDDGKLKDDRVSPSGSQLEWEKYELQEGDLLFARSGATVGKTYLYSKDDGDCIYAGYLIRFKIDNSIAHPKYVFYSTKTPSYKAWVASKQNVVAQPNINAKQYGQELKIPLPPLPQQKRIAAILDAADAYRCKTEALIGKYEELSQSLFLEMFGDRSVQRDEWDEVKIEGISAAHKGSMRTGPFGSNLLHSEFVNEGIPVLGIDNAVQNKFQWKERRFITLEKYEELKRYTVYPGDIIITIMGTVGRVAVVPKDIGLAINTKHLAAITLNKDIANPEFIAFALRSDPYIMRQIKKQGKGAVMTGLNLTIIKGLKLLLPPISLQNQFASRIQAIEAQKAQAQASLAQAEDLFNSLLQRAFKGELVG